MTRLSAGAEKATDYCAYCPKMCRFSCPVAEAEARETVTPWGLMSLLRAARLDQVALTPEVGEAFYHCTGCLRCQVYCRHDNDVPEALIEGRRLLVDSGVAIPKALQGLDLLHQRHGSPFGEVSLEGVSEAFDEASTVGFKPGCRALSEDPERVALTGRLLESLLGYKVALVVAEATEGGPAGHCCGEALREAGYGALAEETSEPLWGAMARFERVITGCAGVVTAWTRRFPGVREGAPVHLIEILAEALPTIIDRAQMPPALTGRRVFYCDSGRVGRRLGLYDQPRAVLAAVLGASPEEFWRSREESLGLGVGAHYESVDPEGAARAAAIFAEQASAEGAEVIVTPDVEGRDHLRKATALEVHDLLGLLAVSLGLG